MPDQHIDLAYLERLYKGDRVRMAQWIQVYLEEAPELFKRLFDNLEQNNAEGLAAAMHDLRPQVHYVGAARMLELLLAIGQQGGADGASARTELVSELRSIRALVDDELRAAIAVG